MNVHWTEAALADLGAVEASRVKTRRAPADGRRSALSRTISEQTILDSLRQVSEERWVRCRASSMR